MCWIRASPHTLLPLILYLTQLLGNVHLAYGDFVEVTAANSSITYFGDWVVQNGGEYRFTAQAGAFAMLNFKGEPFLDIRLTEHRRLAVDD